MASLQIPSEGRIHLLEYIKDGLDAEDIRLGLYIEDHPFDPSDDIATMHGIEADFDGYVAASLATWSAVSSPDPDGRAFITHVQIDFIVTGATNLPQTVFGYFVYLSDSDLLWVQAADTPVELVAPGQSYSVIPKFTLTSEF